MVEVAPLRACLFWGWSEFERAEDWGEVAREDYG